MAYNNLRSKLSRAVAAYLVSLANASVGGASSISPANSRTSKGYPNTTARATLSRVEVPMTGIRRITLHLSIKGSAVKETTETNDDLARKNFDARVAATYDAMMQSDDGQSLRETAELITAAGRALAANADPTIAANNADMVDFTCQELYDMGEGDGTADEEGCDWEEILLFEAVCSPSNVD